MLVLGGAAVAVAVAASAASTKGKTPALPPAVRRPDGGLDGAAAYRRVVARWAAYRAAQGGTPPAGTADVTGALQAAAEAAGEGDRARERAWSVFQSGVGLAFGTEGRSWFQKAWDFGKSLVGTDPTYDPALLDQAAACQKNSLIQGWPTKIYSTQTLTTYAMFSAIRAAICLPYEAYLRLSADRALALHRIYAMLIGNSRTELGALVLKFSQDALIGDEYSDAWHAAFKTVPMNPIDGTLLYWSVMCVAAAALGTHQDPEALAARALPAIVGPLFSFDNDGDNVEHSHVAGAPDPLDATGYAVVKAEIAKAVLAAAGSGPVGGKSLLVK